MIILQLVLMDNHKLVVVVWHVFQDKYVHLILFLQIVYYLNILKVVLDLFGEEDMVV